MLGNQERGEVAVSTNTLDTLKKLATLLQKLGWTDDDFSVINDSPILRDLLNKEIRKFQAMELAHVEVPEVPCRESVVRFLDATLGRIDNSPELSEYRAQRAAEIEELMKPNGLRALLAALDAYSASVLVMRFNLNGTTTERTLAQIGSNYGVSGSAIKAREYKSLMKLRNILLNGLALDPNSIESLMLSDRASSCFKRARIRTVGELLTRSEDELLRITNFGFKSLNEVKEKLAERGLALRED